MAEPVFVGSRIREKRLALGLKQSELAQMSGISASYLNLIEHNRRRIAGKLLNDLAESLNVDPSVLNAGLPDQLVSALTQITAENPRAQIEPIQEFAARYPGWADQVAKLFDLSKQQQQGIAMLTDRLAHDPHLASTLHEVISVITAIRSAAAILTEDTHLEPEWQKRFQRNIDEDSERLAASAENLVRYLDDTPRVQSQALAPRDEMHGVLEAAGFHFPLLEDVGERAIPTVLETVVLSDEARILFEKYLAQYCEDARALPLSPFQLAVTIKNADPILLAREFNVPLAQLFRRLITLPSPGAPPYGLVVCDPGGAILLRKPIVDFDIPPLADACPLWPLFQAFSQPQAPVITQLHQLGGQKSSVQAIATLDIRPEHQFDAPGLTRSVMLLLPDPGGPSAQTRSVGSTCYICPKANCPARRETALVS